MSISGARSWTFSIAAWRQDRLVTAGPDDAIDRQRRLVAAAPGDVIALHNLGVELRRNDCLDEALSVIERALSLGATAPETGSVHAHLLADLGRFDEAVAAYRRVLDRHPTHIDAHETVARLLPQIGRRAEALDAYRLALGRAPHIGVLWISALSAAKDLRDADQLLDWVGAAEARFGTEPFLALLAAQAHSWRAEDGIAMRRVSSVLAREPDNANARATLAQLYLRCGDWTAAEAAASHSARVAPRDQTSWALLSVIWRLQGDPREQWLADYDRFILEIDLDGLDLPAMSEVLSGLHHTIAHPADQSLRGGTQTRGNLFDKAGQPIFELRAAIARAIDGALARLPNDPSHPFLNRNTGAFVFGGSWSVRLRGRGHHVGHIHPAGWISSALYIALPPEVDGSCTAGALTFGTPEALLNLDLPPRRIVSPRPGMLVLFPSYFWHATLPFSSEEARLTVAFDALPSDTPVRQR